VDEAVRARRGKSTGPWTPGIPIEGMGVKATGNLGKTPKEGTEPPHGGCVWLGQEKLNHPNGKRNIPETRKVPRTRCKEKEKKFARMQGIPRNLRPPSQKKTEGGDAPKLGEGTKKEPHGLTNVEKSQGARASFSRGEWG